MPSLAALPAGALGALRQLAQLASRLRKPAPPPPPPELQQLSLTVPLVLVTLGALIVLLVASTKSYNRKQKKDELDAITSSSSLVRNTSASDGAQMAASSAPTSVHSMAHEVEAGKDAVQEVAPSVKDDTERAPRIAVAQETSCTPPHESNDDLSGLQTAMHGEVLGRALHQSCAGANPVGKAVPVDQEGNERSQPNSDASGNLMDYTCADPQRDDATDDTCADAQGETASLGAQVDAIADSLEELQNGRLVSGLREPETPEGESQNGLYSEHVSDIPQVRQGDDSRQEASSEDTTLHETAVHGVENDTLPAVARLRDAIEAGYEESADGSSPSTSNGDDRTTEHGLSSPELLSDVDGNVTCTGGTEGENASEDSPTESSEKWMQAGLDPSGLNQLAAQLSEAHPLLREKAIAWVNSLTRGISPYIKASGFRDGVLTIHLRHSLSGEIATRSRVPVNFELEKALKVAAEVDHSNCPILRLEGILLTPIEGASEVYKRLVPLWGDCESSQAKAAKAWEWWLEYKREFESSKLWRLIESLAGLRTASLIPKKGFMDIIMGCVCVTRSRATTLRYSFFGETNVPQVRCTTEHDRSVSDPQSEHFDPDAEWKSNTARDIATRNVTDSVNRELAEKFAKSGINFSLLFSEVEEQGIKGANPDVIAKLFQQSLVVGGATPLDRLMGAMKWQLDDPTFKATGDHGRVLWRPQSSL